MRVPLSWLREYVDVPEDTGELVRALESLGLKVEAIHSPGEGVEGVVVGEVLRIEPHPNADKLILVDVRLPEGERRVVCGAWNFAAGDRVPVAVPGARVPEVGEITEKKVRGEISHGMLCSAWELGVGDDHSGILVLPADAALGEDVRETLGLGYQILDLEITPNRADCMSLVGVAREIAAFTRGELRIPDHSVEAVGSPVEGLASVTIEDPMGCPRYLARVITGVNVGPSPRWVQNRLLAAGVRPISNVVDATNYSLLVMGHPMHAFDLERLEQRRIIVRKASSGEGITTIDGEERILDASDLVIADATRSVALAGVMGGSDTEVGDTTTSVLLESAYFDPPTIWRTAKRHGLRTDASSRFERGLDIGGVSVSADLACRLIVEWAGGVVAAGAIDIYPLPREMITVEMRPERANLLLGTELTSAEMVGGLERLGLETQETAGMIQVTVPTRRPDLSVEADLIEEVARTVGFQLIPTKLPSGSNRRGGLTREQKLLRRVRQVLTGAGLTEAYTNNLVGPDDLKRLGRSSESILRVANPLSSDESLLRPTLLSGLLRAAERNVARRNLTVSLFEIGHCYLPSGEVLPDEPLLLGIVLHGPRGYSWHDRDGEYDFYDIKGVIEALLAGLRVTGADFRPTSGEGLHPGRAASLMISGRVLGVLGEASPERQAAFDLSHRAQVSELDLGALLSFAEPAPSVIEPPKFPPVLLDLAVALPETVQAAAVLATARRAGGDLLEDVSVFDVYRGDQVGEGRKSLALSLRFRAPERTLTEKEGIQARDAIAGAIRKEHGGQVRSGNEE